VMNVLINALQACGAHGRVDITTRLVERAGVRCGVVSVCDSGPGIPPEHAEQVFDPFFTTKAGGSGLGLFIARQIVTAHGGHITIATAPGGGTDFSIAIPVSPHGEEQDAALP